MNRTTLKGMSPMYWFDFKPDIYREFGFVIRKLYPWYRTLVWSIGLGSFQLFQAENQIHRNGNTFCRKRTYISEESVHFPFRFSRVNGQSPADRNDPQRFGASKKIPAAIRSSFFQEFKKQDCSCRKSEGAAISAAPYSTRNRFQQRRKNSFFPRQLK